MTICRCFVVASVAAPSPEDRGALEYDAPIATYWPEVDTYRVASKLGFQIHNRASQYHEGDVVSMKSLQTENGVILFSSGQNSPKCHYFRSRLALYVSNKHDSREESNASNIIHANRAR